MGIDMLKEKIRKLWHLSVNRETITYIIAGAMTTIVNFASYEGLYRLGLSNLWANGWAWVIAVAFAYIMNKRTVFMSKSSGIMDEASKVTKFFGARLITLGVDQSGMYLFVDRLGFNRLLVKAGLSVIIIILNYIFSKLYIFNRKREQ